MQVIVNDLLTSYEMSGQGKVVVLLHGWGDRATSLGELQQQLAKKFTVIAPDLPGFGATQAPTGAWDLTDYAKFVQHFLKKIAAGEVYAFIGHSNGGAILIRGLGRNILSAEKLCLLSSAGIRNEYQGRNRTLRTIAKAGKVLSAPLPSSTRKKLQRKVYDTIGSDMLVAEHLQETFKKIITDDVRADAAHVTAETLLVYGENDRATPVRYGEILHQTLPVSTLEIIGAAGHFIHQDRPHEVIKLIEDFLR